MEGLRCAWLTRFQIDRMSRHATIGDGCAWRAILGVVGGQDNSQRTARKLQPILSPKPSLHRPCLDYLLNMTEDGT